MNNHIEKLFNTDIELNSKDLPEVELIECLNEFRKLILKDNRVLRPNVIRFLFSIPHEILIK